MYNKIMNATCLVMDPLLSNCQKYPEGLMHANSHRFYSWHTAKLHNKPIKSLCNHLKEIVYFGDDSNLKEYCSPLAIIS
jgi:hypothetical protein